MRKHKYIIGALPFLFAAHSIGASSTNCTEISIQEPQNDSIEVEATVYYPTGRKTADGSQIPSDYRRKTHGWLAVSRDLLEIYSMGDSILVEGISEDVDGIYVIRDKTHKRFRKRIDILVGQGRLYGKWNNVKITRISDNLE